MEPSRKMAMRRHQKNDPKTGRPTIFNDELADRICSDLASGRSARSICKDEDMPSMQTFWRWLRENAAFREQYTRAKAEAADALVEEMIDIADDASNDWMRVDDKEGDNIGWKLNGENIQRSRLRVDTRKWIASKLKPKKYGDQLDLTHGINSEDPIAALIRSVQGTAFKPVPQKMLETWPAEEDVFDNATTSEDEN